MKMQIYAVRDRATDQYIQPMFLLAHGQAIRAFSDEVNNKESNLNKHADDYDLYHLGDWDTDTGLFEAHAPKQIAIGKDLKVKE